jgi:clan AA aspartic protease
VIIGEYRRGFPRVVLTLPDESGGGVDVEFIVDTGFEGYLTLPARTMRLLEAFSSGTQTSMMADGSYRVGALYELTLDWQDEAVTAEVLVLEGNPLLGGALLNGCRISIDATEGGEVVIEPL